MNRAFRTNDAIPPQSCISCGFYQECGGWDDERKHVGCFGHCQNCFNCLCDFTCPVNITLFDRSIEEVGGLRTPPENINSPINSDWPSYIPQIYHGSGRSYSLDESWVSVPLHYICTTDRKGNIDLAFQTREQLCSKMKIRGDARIILTCVCPDRVIEAFWEQHRSRNLLKRIALLGLEGMTTPNYSFVREGPRTNALWNLTRIFRMIERIGDAGIPVIPHLQALTKSDWTKWAEVMKSFPHARHFCMEFQTGLKDTNDSKLERTKYWNHFVDLQMSRGGLLHPIVLAGGGFLREMATISKSYSLIDSTPFMKMEKRQYPRSFQVGGRPRWITVTTLPGEDLSGRLSRNIEAQRAFMFAKNGLDSKGRPQPSLLPAA